MRTSKPFSTISYNTTEFLKAKLDEMVQNGVLDFWGFIEHLPEKDEQKKHKHVYFMPSSQIYTDFIKNQLREPDPLRFDKPLGVMIFKSSKFGDWYLYGLHDKDYLLSKGQYREYQYKKEEFVVSDEDFFNEEIHCIDISAFNQMRNLRECVADGVAFSDMVYNGQIPVQLIRQYRDAYNILKANTLNRAGGTTHTPKFEKFENVCCNCGCKDTADNHLMRYDDSSYVCERCDSLMEMEYDD